MKSNLILMCFFLFTSYLFAGDLFRAIEKGDKKTCELLINNGIDINQYEDIYGDHTPILHALEYYKSDHGLKIIKLLLFYGADVNKTSNDGLDRTVFYWIIETARFLASKSEILEIAGLLLSYGADVNKPIHEDAVYGPLYNAAANEDVDLASLLLFYGAKVDLKFYSMLLWLYPNNIYCLKLLLANGDFCCIELYGKFLSPEDYKTLNEITEKINLPFFDRVWLINIFVFKNIHEEIFSVNDTPIPEEVWLLIFSNINNLKDCSNIKLVSKYFYTLNSSSDSIKNSIASTSLWEKIGHLIKYNIRAPKHIAWKDIIKFIKEDRSLD